MNFAKCRTALVLVAALGLGACAGTGGSGSSLLGTPNAGAVELHTQAVALMRGGDDTGAEALLTRLTSEYPRYASPWLNLAIIHHKRGDKAQSQAAVETALAKDSAFSAAWNLQGVLHRESENIDAAEAAYREALNADGEYAPAWLNLGILLEIYRGRYDAALRAYQRYQELSPPDQVDSRVVGWIADLQRRLDRGT